MSDTSNIIDADELADEAFRFTMQCFRQSKDDPETTLREFVGTFEEQVKIWKLDLLAMQVHKEETDA